VTDPRDRIGAWLDADVEPLPPPPGEFERIRHRARRRKAVRALASAAAAAVVVVAAVSLPRVLPDLLPGHSPAAAAPPAGRFASGSGRLHRTPGSQAGPSPNSSAASPMSLGSSDAPVPGNFRPTSVTFVGPLVGAVIGQAGTPGKCGGPVATDCTSLAGTSDYGKSWYGVPAPVTGAPRGPSGVSQVRFLNLEDGWAFGPQLWVTHDGGTSWTREQTDGLRVTDLETAGRRAFALFAACTGSGSDYAAQCRSFALYTSAAGSDSWQPMPGPAANLAAASGAPASASLVLAAGPADDPQAGTGYLLAPDGSVLSGPLTGGEWTQDAGTPCVPGAAQPDGAPSGALLAAGSGKLYLVCTVADGSAATAKVYLSGDGGTSWTQQVGGLPGSGSVTSLAAAQGGLVVVATTGGIEYSTDNGASWRTARQAAGATAADGFRYVGMTSPSLGVAVPERTGLHEIFITRDGGRIWQPSPIQGG
jgi:photosystem II stability/assembly factor-like uncharacterized protein